MENKERQILSEIMDIMASVRSQLELLDAKVAELQQLAAQEDGDMTPIDIDLDDFSEDTLDPQQETAIEEPVAEDLPEPEPVVEEPEVEDLPEPEPEVEPVVEEPEVEDLPEPEPEFFEEPEEEPEEEPVVEIFEDEDDDLPFFTEPEPEPTPAPAPVPAPSAAPVDQKPRPAVIDSMTDRQAWRSDMPGGAVKDIRSAISLNDRILFINILFGQDPMAFQEALTRINQMESLDEVVEYVAAERPDWDLESETVYRFMMAVRRKIR